jgi:adenylate kinase
VKGRIVLLGPPASGKGTQAEMIKAAFQIEPASPGAMLRDEKKAGTPLGVEADRLTSRGQLVPDHLIVELVQSWLGKNHSDTFVFDGFPRTIGQAEALENLLARLKKPLQVAFFLDADFETVRERVARRMVCETCGNIAAVGLHIESASDLCPRCGGRLQRRNDDDEETLKQRMAEYREKSEPLNSYYTNRGLLQRIDANRIPSEVFADISSGIEE